MLSKGLLAVLIALTLIGCGRDGSDGRDGEDGKPYIPPGDVEESVVCQTKWDLTGAPAGRSYDLKYEVQRTKAKEIFVTLTSQYRTSKAAQAPDVLNVKYSATDKKAQNAYIASLMWEVTLSGKTATVKRIPFNDIKEASCQ